MEQRCDAGMMLLMALLPGESSIFGIVCMDGSVVYSWGGLSIQYTVHTHGAVCAPPQPQCVCTKTLLKVMPWSLDDR